MSEEIRRKRVEVEPEDNTIVEDKVGLNIRLTLTKENPQFAVFFESGHVPTIDEMSIYCEDELELGEHQPFHILEKLMKAKNYIAMEKGIFFFYDLDDNAEVRTDNFVTLTVDGCDNHLAYNINELMLALLAEWQMIYTAYKAGNDAGFGEGVRLAKSGVIADL